MNAKTLLFWRKITLAVILVGTSALSAAGQTEISNADGLKAIAENLSGSYILTADIELTDSWTPIGTDAVPFTGTIDGNGKVIKGLNYSNSATNGVGFIGVARGATITNLGIVNAQLEGRQDVGGIVGRAFNPVTISQCYVSGIIKGYDHVAGIVGGSRAGDGALVTITDSYSTAAVVSTTYQAAGIIGTPVDAVVDKTYFAGSVKNYVTSTGGIAALLDGGSSTITNNVSIAVFIRGGAATNRILGNIDNKEVTLENNYAWDETEVYRSNILEEIASEENVTTSTNGLAKTKAELQTAAFYTGDLEWSATVWKFEAGAYPVLAAQTLPADLDAIYTELQSQTTSPGTQLEANAFSALGKTLTYSSSAPAVASIDNNGAITINAPGEATITIATAAADAYAKAVSITRTFQVVDVNANITTASHLNAIRYKLDGEYTLQNDITLTEDWAPIANFTGKLNGNGHIIYGLHYEDQETNNVGLFASAQGAEITKLGIEDARLVGNADVGAIVGNASGTTISESYVANSYIAGRDHVGSIVGAMRTHSGNNTVINNCYASAQIYSRQYQAGGLVGIIAGGDLRNSYFSGIVNCPGRAMGLISLVDSDDPSSIENSFNAAAYLLGGSTKRIVDGVRTSTTLTNNYTLRNTRLGTDMNTAGISQNPDNNAAGDQGATIENDNQARTSNWYKTTLSWDFNNVWKTLVEGEIYPVLKWQTAPIRTSILNTPEPDYLVWGDDESFYSLDKITESHGITLDFSVDSDEYVDLIDLIVYPTENNINEEGTAVFTASIKNAQLKTLLTLQNPTFNIDVFMGDRVDEISTVDEFLAIGTKLVGNYKLLNNIDMQGVSFTGFGSGSAPFAGSLDGDGYAIQNLTITAGGNKQGVFNATSGATIKNLGLVNLTVSGANAQDIGGLIGSSSATSIEECYVTGNITGHDHVGAFVGGDNGGTRIKNSYANANVTTTGWQVGGLVGTLNGGVIIENTYFAGEVLAPTDGWPNNAGGIASLLEKNNEDCDIKGTVSIGNVTGGTTGRFLARSNSYTPDGATEEVGMKLRTFDKNLYYINATISEGDAGGYEKQTDGRVVPTDDMARSLTQLKQQATYVAIGWDFTDIWTIDEDNAYPVLKNQKPITGGNSIQEPEKQEAAYTVYATGKAVLVNGIATTAIVSVFNSNGQLISKSVETGNAIVPLPAKGFYIVRIVENNRNHSVKIVNK